ncbi:Hypothetical protein POVN_LOCUS400 [uncultured virus]|nr:Hypothetical protein POVN_LOCUS400 [uncultured virus]
MQAATLLRGLADHLEHLEAQIDVEGAKEVLDWVSTQYPLLGKSIVTYLTDYAKNKLGTFTIKLTTEERSFKALPPTLEVVNGSKTADILNSIAKLVGMPEDQISVRTATRRITPNHEWPADVTSVSVSAATFSRNFEAWEEGKDSNWPFLASDVTMTTLSTIGDLMDAFTVALPGKDYNVSYQIGLGRIDLPEDDNTNIFDWLAEKDTPERNTEESLDKPDHQFHFMGEFYIRLT